MLELEDELRRYGQAVEQHLLDRAEAIPALMTPADRRWRGIAVGVATLIVLVAGAVAVVAGTANDQDAVVAADTARPTDARHAGVFTTPTDTVLLFSDGIDGVTAIDLDRRLAGRRVIEGERAGDQQFRLTLTGDHLLVGWGEIYAAPLDGGPSEKVADATIYLPASENGEVWTLTWEGGRIGAGPATLRRIRLDGTTVFETDSFDPSTLEPVQGVPGGLLVNSPEGVAVWDAHTQTTGPVLGPGRAIAAATDGHIVAWCTDNDGCADVHTAALARTGPPTAPHVSPGAQQLALSPDGADLAFLRTVGDTADLVLASPSSATDGTVVAHNLDTDGAVSWSQDGRQLFYTEYSYLESSMRVGRYDPTTAGWEIETLPVGDGLGAIPINRDEARLLLRRQPGVAARMPQRRRWFSKRTPGRVHVRLLHPRLAGRVRRGRPEDGHGA